MDSSISDTISYMFYAKGGYKPIVSWHMLSWEGHEKFGILVTNILHSSFRAKITLEIRSSEISRNAFSPTYGVKRLSKMNL